MCGRNGKSLCGSISVRGTARAAARWRGVCKMGVCGPLRGRIRALFRPSQRPPELANLMPEIAREILPVSLEEEMRQSYLDYAMSVIVGRALPDVRDGLKPVHRRVLLRHARARQRLEQALQEIRARRRRRHRQIPPARRYRGVRHHRAHGAAVLDALSAGRRPGQLRLGRWRHARRPCATPKCACRESRTSCWPTSTRKPSISSPNYDESEHEPSVLPARVPNLLINGAVRHRGRHGDQHPAAQSDRDRQRLPGAARRSGAAAGGADAAHSGPGFPDRRHHQRRAGDRHRLPHRPRPPVGARARRTSRTIGKGDRQAIIVTELPYQVNKARLIERIAELVREKQIEGIARGCAMSPTRTACASSSSSSAAKWPRSCSTTCTRRRRWRRCSASTWWRCRTASRS